MPLKMKLKNFADKHAIPYHDHKEKVVQYCAYNGCPLTAKDVRMEDCPTCHIVYEEVDGECRQVGYGFDPSGRKYAPRYNIKTGVRYDVAEGVEPQRPTDYIDKVYYD